MVSSCILLTFRSSFFLVDNNINTCYTVSSTLKHVDNLEYRALWSDWSCLGLSAIVFFQVKVIVINHFPNHRCHIIVPLEECFLLLLLHFYKKNMYDLHNYNCFVQTQFDKACSFSFSLLKHGTFRAHLLIHKSWWNSWITDTLAATDASVWCKNIAIWMGRHQCRYLTEIMPLRYNDRIGSYELK